MNLTYGLLSSKSKLALRMELLMMELFGSVWMTLSNISEGFKFARFKMITFSIANYMRVTLKFGNLILKHQVHTPFQSPRKESECSQRMQVMNTATLECSWSNFRKKKSRELARGLYGEQLVLRLVTHTLQLLRMTSTKNSLPGVMFSLPK